MADTTGILSAIDHAVEDWAVSGDAMRWSPAGHASEIVRRPDAIISVSTAAFVAQLRVAVHALDRLQRPRWHRRRCPVCHPLGFTTAPCPFPAGYDYRRRSSTDERGTDDRHRRPAARPATPAGHR